ncbi:hypothetical protein [Enterovibrio norvegicus]|uniref:hypothetical protein n=1 Tax=Enterovibrio norvegicus TaxID=188144 RepID=UPI00352FE726
MKLSAHELSTISPDVLRIGGYFCGLYFAAYLLGKLSQFFMLKWNPYKTSMFAFDTPWYYELKGKLSAQQDAQIIKLSCLQDGVLYYGFLEDFYLDKDGQLDRLALSDVSRRTINDDDDNEQSDREQRYYPIKGDRLILKYGDISNVNIEYLYLTRLNSPSETLAHDVQSE